MTSEPRGDATFVGPPERAYVWAWLPGETDPVAAGLLEAHPTGDGGQLMTFAYGRPYLENPNMRRRRGWSAEETS